MRILFCSNVPLRRTLGAPKVLIELAEAMSRAGHDCRLIGPTEVVPGSEDRVPNAATYSSRLRDYLQRNAAQYDAIDYGHEYLPFPRSDFPPGPLMVARSVLLAHHFERIPLPRPSGWAPAVRQLLAAPAERRRWRRVLDTATATIRAADLVNVSNTADKAELVRRGIHLEKVVVLPFGLSTEDRLALARSADDPGGGNPPTVAFVGTFDYRKGAREFPEIVSRVVRALPTARFRLLGVGGLFKAEGDIRRMFPESLARRLDIRLTYQPSELPELLRGCAAGVFPSHVEGFGFGVVEMLAAGLPVVAYDVPGPPMMLPPDLLVPRGRADLLSDRLVRLLRDRSELERASNWARRRAADFCWDRIARDTDVAYTGAITRRGGQAPTPSAWAVPPTVWCER